MAVRNTKQPSTCKGMRCLNGMKGQNRKGPMKMKKGGGC